MTITGLLALGAAEIVDHATQELLGYVFTQAHGQGQLQRWLLLRNPHNEFEIRSPSKEMAGWSLDDWQDHVAKSWRPNAFYVWAQADVYTHGDTYGETTWKQIPSADDLPKPSFPDRPGSNFQLDYLDGKVIRVVQDDWMGRAYVVRGLSQESSIEYWVLPARYVPAGEARTRVSTGSEQARSLSEFVEMNQSSWTPGATLIITGCLNYTGEAAPFAP